MIWNVQQTVKMRPKVTPRRPRASQTLFKWSPRPPQIRFLSNFGIWFFLVVNLHRFFAVLWQNLLVKSRPLKFTRPRSVLLTSARFGMFRKKYQKSSKNLPKPFQNRRKIEKNQNKSMEKAKMSEESQKMRYKFEKITKSGPTWPT